MTLGDWASIATIIQSILVVISLIFVWYQLRENTRLTRAANSQKFVELSSSYNLQLIQDREMATLWEEGNGLWDKMDAIDRGRYKNLLIWWLLLHESIYHQWRKNLLDTETYNAWEHDLRHFIKTKNVSFHWNDMKGAFETGFAQHISQIIVAQANKSQSQTQM
jgi:hypothetical protein